MSLPIPPVLRHPEPFDREDQPPLDVSAESSHAYSNPRVFERHDYRDRQLVPPEPVDYHRGLKDVMNLSSNERSPDFPHRDTLWSVARLSLDRHDHVYKEDAPRSYAIGNNSRGKYTNQFSEYKIDRPALSKHRDTFWCLHLRSMRHTQSALPVVNGDNYSWIINTDVLGARAANTHTHKRGGFGVFGVLCALKGLSRLAGVCARK